MKSPKFEKGLCVVHIEDEYAEFRGLVQTVRTIIEDHLDRTSPDRAHIAAARRVAATQEWEAYEFQVEGVELPPIRYIFVRDATVPVEVEGHMLDEMAFVIDALRVDDGSPELTVSAPKSIDFIRKRYRLDLSRIVLFTAFEGDGAFDGQSGPVRRIYKNNDMELERYLSDFVVDFLDRLDGGDA